MEVTSSTRNWNQTSVPGGMPAGQGTVAVQAPVASLKKKNWLAKGFAWIVPPKAFRGADVNESQASMIALGGVFVSVSVAGLPAVRGNTSAEILYEQSLAPSAGTDSVTLHDPTREKQFDLLGAGGLGGVPASARVSVVEGKTYFPNLPPHLENRFFFDPNRGLRGALVLRGEFVDSILGEEYLRLNVLGQEDLASVKALVIAADPAKRAVALGLVSMLDPAGERDAATMAAALHALPDNPRPSLSRIPGLLAGHENIAEMVREYLEPSQQASITA